MGGPPEVAQHFEPQVRLLQWNPFGATESGRHQEFQDLQHRVLDTLTEPEAAQPRKLV
jgi:hypothetical protein